MARDTSSAVYVGAALYAVAVVVLVAVRGLSAGTLAACALCAVLVVASVTDLRVRIVPNACIVVGIVFWALFVVWQALTSAETGVIAESLISVLGALGVSVFLLVVGGVFEALAHKKGLGGGDIKLFFVTGLYLGPVGNVLNLFLSCVLGVIFGWWWNHRTGHVPTAYAASMVSDGGFPFAPAIAVSTWVCLLL